MHASVNQRLSVCWQIDALSLAWCHIRLLFVMFKICLTIVYLHSIKFANAMAQPPVEWSHRMGRWTDLRLYSTVLTHNVPCWLTSFHIQSFFVTQYEQEVFISSRVSALTTIRGKYLLRVVANDSFRFTSGCVWKCSSPLSVWNSTWLLYINISMQ